MQQRDVRRSQDARFAIESEFPSEAGTPPSVQSALDEFQSEDDFPSEHGSTVPRHHAASSRPAFVSFLNTRVVVGIGAAALAVMAVVFVRPHDGPVAPVERVVATHPHVDSTDEVVTKNRPRQLADRGAATMPVPLVRSSDIRHQPAYSPAFGVGGTVLFFHEGKNGATSLLKATLADDGSLAGISTLMRDGSSNYHVQESPDQMRIAFDSDRDGVRGVYVADHDGARAMRISGEGYAAVPHWSPDGAHLVFIRAEPRRPKVWNLWTWDTATSTLDRLTSHSIGQPWGGSWFPDSRRLAYSYEDRLVILDTRSGEQRVFPSPLRRRLVRTPAVSPDGRWIVFQVYRDGVWALDVRRGSMRRILNDRSAEEFAWSPDGRSLAYHSRRDGEWGIWSIPGRAIS